ncbi:MAG: ribose 5-phosphate isomerase B [Clostridia bacterium]|nr:ribose 5-phosphate isomerase B [Clostridia bacterium]
MKIAIGSDHGGFELKGKLIAHLKENGYEVEDCGTYEPKSCNYPEIAKKVADKVVAGEVDKGILCCGTGIGMSIAANKVKGVRAAVVSDAFSTKYTRLHNDTNILCLGERVIGPGLAAMLVDIFLTTEFEGGRHQVRVDMITDLEK